MELDRIKFPGPGRYDELRVNSSPKWTMRPITKEELFEKTTIKFNPGPGAHDSTMDLNPEGKYFSSKHKASGSKVWNPKSSQRFNKSTTDAPGAGAYEPFNDLSDSGKYVMSKYKGDGKRKFGISSRDSFVHQPAKETKSTNILSQRLVQARTDCLPTSANTTRSSTKLGRASSSPHEFSSVFTHILMIGSSGPY